MNKFIRPKGSFILLIALLIGNIIPYKISNLIGPKLILCNDTPYYINNIEINNHKFNAESLGKDGKCSQATKVSLLREINKVELHGNDENGFYEFSNNPNWDMGPPHRIWFGTHTLVIKKLNKTERIRPHYIGGLEQFIVN